MNQKVKKTAIIIATGWIMKDIQNNILQVIQTRCETNLL
jgi:hypothetical protein